MTAVEWLIEELEKGNFEQQQKAIEQAKEMEKQQQDELAIGFADWVNENYAYYNGDGEYHCHIKNKWYKPKELLEIYKKGL